MQVGAGLAKICSYVLERPSHDTSTSESGRDKVTHGSSLISNHFPVTTVEYSSLLNKGEVWGDAAYLLQSQYCLVFSDGDIG
jgi:hypothetical protein